MKWLFIVLMVLNVGYFAVEGYLRMATPAEETISEEQDPQNEVKIVEKCLYLDFENDQFLNAAYKKLVASNVAVEYKSYFTTNSKEYWLIKGPFESLAAANDQVQLLRLQKIDSFVLNKNGFSNTLSFGVFPSKQQALQMQSGLAQKQIKAELKVIEDKTEDKWLKILASDVYKVESSWLSGLQNNYYLKKNVKKSCK